MKILLLDTAFGSLPIYKYLRNQTDDVWVIGNRPTDVLARKAKNRWIECDYSNINLVNQYVHDNRIDFIVPGCTDISMETYLSLEFKNKYRDSTTSNDYLSNKSMFRSLCKNLNISSPQIVNFDDLPYNGKLICKPVDAFSGLGVTVVDGNDSISVIKGFETALSHSRSSKAIIETFQEGDLYSCSSFIKNKRIVDAFYVREGSSTNPYAVDTSYVTHSLKDEIKSIVKFYIEKLSDHLHLTDGLVHVQFILSDEIPYIIEITRRCPGDLYPLLIEYSNGYNYASKYASYFIGIEEPSNTVFSRFILRHTISSNENMIFSGINFSQMSCINAYFPVEKVGLEMYAGKTNRAGIIFQESKSYIDLQINYKRHLLRNVYSLE